jgi:hypothetical protein
MLTREAIDQGLSSDDTLGIETDPNLKSLHGDPPIHLAHRRTKKARCRSDPD